MMHEEQAPGLTHTVDDTSKRAELQAPVLLGLSSEASPCPLGLNVEVVYI